MSFCPNCNNILNYIENTEGILEEKCKVCNYSTECNKRIISTTLYKKNENYIENKHYYVYDPTLPRTKHKICPNENCPSRKNTVLQEAVFYSDPVTLRVIYICVVCKTEWKYS